MRRDESRKPFANGLLSIFNRVICKNGKHTELQQLLKGESGSLEAHSKDDFRDIEIAFRIRLKNI